MEGSAGALIIGITAKVMRAVHATVSAAHHSANFRLHPRSTPSCWAASGTVTAKHSRLGMR